MRKRLTFPIAYILIFCAVFLLSSCSTEKHVTAANKAQNEVSMTFAPNAVSFKGSTKDANGNSIELTGKLFKPKGDGPFPAAVLMHGCAGISKANDAWAEKLTNWGYVALEVDSLGPRGEIDICANLWKIPFHVRTYDAYDAKSFLSGLPYVDRNRIALMGWSHGGCATLASISRSNYIGFAAAAKSNTEPPIRKELFNVAIAFYPYCVGQLDDSNAPLLILSGELDTWCPAALCKEKMPKGKTSNEVQFKSYPGAYHGFDLEGVDVTKGEHRVAYNPDAFADSTVRIKAFLDSYLK